MGETVVLEDVSSERIPRIEVGMKVLVQEFSGDDEGDFVMDGSESINEELEKLLKVSRCRSGSEAAPTLRRKKMVDMYSKVAMLQRNFMVNFFPIILLVIAMTCDLWSSRGGDSSDISVEISMVIASNVVDEAQLLAWKSCVSQFSSVRRRSRERLNDCYASRMFLIKIE